MVAAPASPVLTPCLHRLPAVNRFLASHDLGMLPAAKVAAFPGRNEIWAGRTTAGRKVFVKRITGDPDSVARRFERSLAFHRVSPPVTAPRCLAWDRAGGLLAFGLVDGARSGHDLAEDGAFGAEVAGRMGALVGRLHAARRVDLGLADQSVPEWPSAGWLRGLPPDVYAGASGGFLQLWGIVQSDDDLVAALARLCDAERAAERVAAHCDLRLGQFLVRAGRVYLTDWEEFRAGDPARDVGTYAGEWLYRAIVSVPGSITDGQADEDGEDGPAADHDRVVSACAAQIEVRRRLVQAFWHAYQAHAPTGAGLAERAAGFAGWHVIDRVIALAGRRARISATDRAAVGIARMVLLKPASAAALVGLDGGP